MTKMFKCVLLNVLLHSDGLLQTRGLFFSFYLYFQVMETERMIYLVTEYASGGEIFGKGLPSRRLRLSLVLEFSLFLQLFHAWCKKKIYILNELNFNHSLRFISCIMI